MENNTANDQTETLNYTARKKLVKELLDWCYDHTFIKNLRAKKGNKDTLLHWACENGKLEIVEYLFEENHATDVNCIGNNDDTPLHKAATNGHNDIVKYLIDKNANIIGKNKDDHTPLTLALGLGPQYEGPGHLDVIKTLIEKGAELNVNDNALEWIIKTGMVRYHEENLELAKLAIAKGANIIWDYGHHRTLLHYLAGFEGFSVQIKHGSFRQFSTKEGNPFQVGLTILLLEKGLDINAKDDWSRTPLHTALNERHFEYAKLLVDSGALLNTEDINGDTPIETALRNHEIKTAEYLLKKGAKIPNIDIALMQASKGNNRFTTNTSAEVCEFLISLGAKINCQDDEGNTPLIAATKSVKDNGGVSAGRRFDVVEFLIKQGANVRLQNKEMNTALHYVWTPQFAEILLKHGAETNVKNSKGETPKDISIKNKYHKVTQLFVEYENKRKIEQSEQIECIICFEPKNGTFAFLPCGHAKTCQKCCMNIMHPNNNFPRCPTCRQPVTMYQKIFI